MTTKEIDSQRVLLAREILNTEDIELLKELTKAYKRIKSRLAKSVTVKVEPKEDSKEYILNGLKEAFTELKEIKAGRLKGIPARELLKDLEEEDAE